MSSSSAGSTQCACRLGSRCTALNTTQAANARNARQPNTKTQMPPMRALRSPDAMSSARGYRSTRWSLLCGCRCGQSGELRRDLRVRCPQGRKPRRQTINEAHIRKFPIPHLACTVGRGAAHCECNCVLAPCSGWMSG